MKVFETIDLEENPVDEKEEPTHQISESESTQSSPYLSAHSAELLDHQKGVGDESEEEEIIEIDELNKQLSFL